jgi:hypothetical protein
MIRRLHKAIASIFVGSALSLTLASSSSAALIGLTETDFTDWTAFHLVFDDPTIAGQGPLTATGSGQRIVTGGNPGAFFRFTHTMSTGEQSIIGAVDPNASYNPGTDGPIPFLALDFDIKANTSNGATGLGLLVKQNNTIYYSIPWFVVPLSTGFTRQRFSIALDAFDSNPLAGIGGILPTGNRPDFSPTGAPMQFGMAFLTTVAGGGTGTLILDVDNLTPAPEPLSTLLLVPGAVWLIGRRQRHGSHPSA